MNHFVIAGADAFDLIWIVIVVIGIIGQLITKARKAISDTPREPNTRPPEKPNATSYAAPEDEIKDFFARLVANEPAPIRTPPPVRQAQRRQPVLRQQPPPEVVRAKRVVPVVPEPKKKEVSAYAIRNPTPSITRRSRAGLSGFQMQPMRAGILRQTARNRTNQLRPDWNTKIDRKQAMVAHIVLGAPKALIRQDIVGVPK